MKIEIDLLMAPKFDALLNSVGILEYRVRKVEYEGDLVKAKYGLSWETGEWIKVEEGCKYPEETRLIMNK